MVFELDNEGVEFFNLIGKLINFDDLKLGQIIGHGTFGIVYEATYKTEELESMKVAIKTFKESGNFC